MEKAEKGKRRKFSEEYKAETVRLIQTSGKSIAQLARDLGDRKITVNNIQPGPVDTEANPASGPFADTMLGFMAVKRYGHADEVAAMTAYLAGSEAGYITGASLLIDGGFAA